MSTPVKSPPVPLDALLPLLAHQSHQPVSVRLPEELATDLRRVANSWHISRNQLIVALLHQGLATMQLAPTPAHQQGER